MSNLKALAFAGLLAISSAACAQVGGGGGMGAWTLYYTTNVLTHHTPPGVVGSYTNSTGSSQPWYLVDLLGDAYCTGDSPTYEPDWDLRVGSIYGLYPDPPDPIDVNLYTMVPDGGTVSATIYWDDEFFAQTWLWSDGETQAARESQTYTTTYVHLNTDW